MRRLDAMLRLYDVTDWSWYDVNEGSLKGNKCYNITFSFASKYERTFEITVFKTTLYISGVKSTVFSKSFIKGLYCEIDNFFKVTK